MATITQTGYDFIYRQRVSGRLPIVETWGIERVAAYMFLIEFYRVRSQRYVGSFTFVSRVGNIQYELSECDKETNHDLDKLTKVLLPYTSDDLCTMWYTSFDMALNMAEKMIKEKIALAEEPYEMLGQKITPPRFLTRPTREEYEAREKEEQEKMGDAPAGVGATIRVLFYNLGIIPCRIVRETDSWYWVDGYVDGEVAVANARVKKGTSRIITDKE